MVDVKEFGKVLWKVLIIVAFFILTLTIGSAHEPWSDEAQSYLLARDTSLVELLGYMKYEGTPSLWVMVIKLFILLGGQYQLFFLLPAICSTIGIIIFEFKIKAPWYIKVLFPFTYFMFFQYSVVARSYSLVFPLLMILAVFYEKRFEKPILYAIILFFFMSISLHTLLIAGSLYFIFLVELYKNKSFKEKKAIIACVLIFLELLFTAICTYPARDCSFPGNGGKPIYRVFSEATIGSYYEPIFEIVITIFILAILILALKNRKLWDFAKLVILFAPVILVFVFLAFQGWHIGIIWLLLFTYFIVSNLINENEFIKLFVVFVCITQIYWTASSCMYDLKEKYSGSEEVAEFIKSLDYEDKTIYGLGYSVTAIQPYFEENLFDNLNTDKSFYLWKDENGYMKNSEILEKPADIYVISKFYAGHYLDIFEKLYKSSQYTKYEFDGYTYIKNFVYEIEGYYVFVKDEKATSIKYVQYFN